MSKGAEEDMFQRDDREFEDDVIHTNHNMQTG